MYNALHFTFLFEYMSEVFVIVVRSVLGHYCLKIHSSALHGYTIIYSNLPLLMGNKEVSCLSTYQTSLLISFAFYILPLLYIFFLSIEEKVYGRNT